MIIHKSPFLKLIFISLFLQFHISFGENIEFEIKGKQREVNGSFEIFTKDDDKIKVMVLPMEPRQLCASLSNEGKLLIEQLEGLGMGRWSLKGICKKHETQDKHIALKITEMKPLGQGVTHEETKDLVGRLEVVGDPNSEDYLKKSMMLVHIDENIVFRIPAKKFNPKPSGLSYQEASRFDGKKIEMNARVQYYHEPPYRVATINKFQKSSD